MLLDVGLRLLSHPVWADPQQKITPSPAASRFLQSPELLGVMLLLLVLQATSFAQAAGTSSSSHRAPDSTSTAHPDTPTGSQQPGQELQQQQLNALWQQLDALWQQLGFRTELLPCFLDALHSKDGLRYAGRVAGYADPFVTGVEEPLKLTGAAGGFVLATGLLLRLLIVSPALRALGLAEHAVEMFVKDTGLPAKVLTAGKQQQLLLASVVLQLPVALLSTAALDPSNTILQYAAVTTSELLLCCWQELASQHAAAFSTGASSSTAGVSSSSSTVDSSSSSSKDASSRTSTGASSSTKSGGKGDSSSNSSSMSAESAQLRIPAGIASSVQQLLQCWCCLMQQQLQLAVAGTQAAAPDSHPTGRSTDTHSVDQGGALDNCRLNTISCLLPLLVTTSNNSMFLGAGDPWSDSLGQEVLQLLEQYVRTVLPHLQLSFDEQAAGDNDLQLKQWQQQRQRLQAGVRAQPASTNWSQAGVHAHLRVLMCPCCMEKPGHLNTGRHRQLNLVLHNLLFYIGKQQHLHPDLGQPVSTVRDGSGKVSLCPAPLLYASRAPGNTQQQLLALLLNVHKRVQGSLADVAEKLVNNRSLALHYLYVTCQPDTYREHGDYAEKLHLCRDRAGTAALCVALLGRSLIFFSSRMAHLLQAAAAAVHATSGSDDGRRMNSSSSSSSGSNSRRQRRALLCSSDGRDEGDMARALDAFTGSADAVIKHLSEASEACKQLAFLSGLTQIYRPFVALDQACALVVSGNRVSLTWAALISSRGSRSCSSSSSSRRGLGRICRWHCSRVRRSSR
jgi:hypothetical protein